MRRDVVRHLQGAYAIGERRACHATGFHRSSQRCCSRRDPQTELRVRLREPAASRVRYGYRRLHVLPRREGCRSAKNEAWLAEHGLFSRIHRKKPPRRPTAARTRRANARKSAVRSAVEHVFARQKGPMGLVVRTIGIAMARVKIGLANLAYNLNRFVWLSGRPATA